MTKLTDVQINNYIESGANICPYCEKHQLMEGQADFNAVTAWRNIACHFCGKEWTEAFELVTIEPLEE